MQIYLRNKERQFTHPCRVLEHVNRPVFSSEYSISLPSSRYLWKENAQSIFSQRNKITSFGFSHVFPVAASFVTI